MLPSLLPRRLSTPLPLPPAWVHRRSIQILRTVREVREVRRRQMLDELSPTIGATSGFVPTMGALHDGHLKLMERSRMENPDSTWVSVFVNPSQFAPHEDFTKYPRQLENDVEKMRRTGFVDYVFAPEVSELYPAPRRLDALPTSTNAQRTFVVPMGVEEEDQAEGKSRPGHFRGVATVVTKLFNIVQPTNAYFGQKDGLQCIVIKQLARELNIPVRITACETVREKDGLAMSSRNVYLSATQRARAPVLYKALSSVRDAYYRSAVAAAESHSVKMISKAGLVDVARAILEKESKDGLFRPEYISIVDGDTGIELKPEDVLLPPKDYGYYMCSAAINFGNCRILDNVLFGTSKYAVV